jgi:hypothetical protein
MVIFGAYSQQDYATDDDDVITKLEDSKVMMIIDIKQVDKKMCPDHCDRSHDDV